MHFFWLFFARFKINFLFLHLNTCVVSIWKAYCLVLSLTVRFDWSPRRAETYDGNINVEAGIGRGITTYWKGVYLTLIFGYTNLANSNSSEESNGRCPQDVIISIPVLTYIHVIMHGCSVGTVTAISYRRGLWRCSFSRIGQCESLCSGMNNK